MKSIKRLAIVTTHPIQYYAPVFRLLHERGVIAINVFYTWGEQGKDKYDPGFNRKIAWDIPLTNGYPHVWVINKASDPGSHHFNGIITPDLNKQLIAWEPDAILYIGWAYQGHLQSIRFFKGKKPVYFRGDSTLLDPENGLRSLTKSLYLRWVYSKVDQVFYVGCNNKAYFKKYGLTERRLTFAPHAIDNDRFAKSRPMEVVQLKEALGIGLDEKIVLFAGKFEKKKSPDLLLEAFLHEKIEGVHLLFVGNGSLEASLKRRASGQRGVHFIDFKNQSEMPVYYQACDLFCLPSRGPGETWGLAVNEAMACGKAILVSDKVGCAADLVRPGINGAIFKSDDLTNLGRNLKQMLSSGELLESYGANSQRIIADWNFKAIAEAIQNKLNETI